MAHSLHRIRLLGAWSLSHEGAYWVLGRRFHAPTGLMPGDRVCIKWTVEATVRVHGARLNERALPFHACKEDEYESQNILEGLQPSNELLIMLECTVSETQGAESHVVPSADSKWLKTACLEIVSC